jgi:molybdate transport system substrate-binding protein
MIYAAATLKNALDTVVEAARTALHVHVTPVYGPSPALVQQLQNGAPGDIFFSADSDWMDEAVVRGVVHPLSRRSALHTLVLITPATQRKRSRSPGFPLAALLAPDGLCAINDDASRAAMAGQHCKVLGSGKVSRIASPTPQMCWRRHLCLGARLGHCLRYRRRLDQAWVVRTFPPDNHPPSFIHRSAVART